MQISDMERYTMAAAYTDLLWENGEGKDLLNKI